MRLPLQIIGVIIVMFACGFLLAMCAEEFAQEFRSYGAIDGDTILIAEPCNTFQPDKAMKVRIYGIDTPETRQPPALCASEIIKGLAAKKFAQGLVKRGGMVTVEFVTQDRYACRIVGKVKLRDGRDFGEIMIARGYARPYGIDGNLTKQSWCK